MTVTNPRKIGVYHYLGFSHLRGGTLKTVCLLADAGHDVTLIILPPRDNAPSQIEQQVPPNVTVRRVHLWTRRLPRFQGTLFKLAELMVRHVFHAWRSKFDLYVAIDAPAALPVFIGTRFQRKKVLYLALELFAEMPWVQARPLWRLVDRYLCPHFNGKEAAIVAVDEYRAQYMLEHYKAGTLPFTIRNTPPFRTVQPSMRMAEFLEANGVAGAKVAICQGNIEDGRNIEVMIDAAQYLPEGIVLMFLGWSEKEYLAKVQDRVGRMRLGKHVLFHPPVLPEEVWDFIGSAHVGLLVYKNVSLNYYYSCGASLRLYEYLMAGLPVVAPNFPGFPERVEGEQLGLCVDPTQPEAIAGAIAALVADDAAWEAASARARAAAKEKYCWELDGAKLLGICEDIMR